jgi:hypothetical protein
VIRLIRNKHPLHPGLIASKLSRWLGSPSMGKIERRSQALTPTG